MFSLAMKRGFVAEGKFSRNKSRPFTMLSLRLIFLSDLIYPLKRIIISFSPVQKYNLASCVNKWTNGNGN